MFCIVYPLRREGKKLQPEEVRQGGRRGWLTILKMPDGQPVWIARLSAPNGGEVHPQLTCASVKAVDGGLLISGFVDRGAYSDERQAWWCEPFFEEGLQRPPRQKLPHRHRQMR